MGSVSLGYGPDGKRIRRKVSGKTKQEVRAKLQALHEELNAGVKSSSTYTLREAIDDWLREGLDDTSERTRALYEGLLEPLLDGIGARLLRDIGARDVRAALSQLVDREGPWRGVEDVTLATLEWVAWYNGERLHSACGYMSPERI